jgi:hypothetical protein
VNPDDVLLGGRDVLAPVLVPVGFAFVLGTSGTGSGGRYASGEFVRDDRRLTLHVRHSLGLVSYTSDSLSASHDAYVRMVNNGRAGDYPGFSSDPMSAFDRLRRDIGLHGELFLRGTDADLRALLTRAAAWERGRSHGPGRLP